MMREEDEENPLLKEVPSHLFQFEEKIFGMTLPQLLCDIGAGVGIIAATASLQLVTRIVVSVLAALPVLLLVHGSVQDQSLLHWLYLYVRFLTIPRYTIWQSPEELQARKRKGHPPSVQTTWIQLDTLESGIMGYSEPGGKRGRTRGRYWVVFEVEGRNVRYLPEQEQVRLFGRFESFLVGLDFRLQFISTTEQVRAEAYPPYLAQKRMLARLPERAPRIARLQQYSVDYQRAHLRHCTATRYFIVVSVSAREEAVRLDSNGATRSPLALLWKQVSFKKSPEISRAQVIDQLRIRASALKKLFGQLEMRAWLLGDSDLLRTFTSCLALGADVPSFQPQLLDDEEVVEAALHLAVSLETPADLSAASSPAVGEAVEKKAAPSSPSRASVRRNSLRGLHGKFVYTSKNPRVSFEAGVLRLADLVAPSSIEVQPGQVVVEVRGQKRYQRYIAVTGYGHQLLCGWVGDLTELGLPMVIVSQLDPIDTPFMINRLEGQLVKLESQRYTDQKTVRITRANQSVEAEQVKRVVQLLAGRRMKIFAVTMLIGIHASIPERLEQRTKYLLSHVRQKQLRVRPTTRRHDESWQASLPVCPPTVLDLAFTMPSDAASTFLHCSSGTVGTKSGALVGFVVTGLSRRPVYWNPWLLPNPHMVGIGETGSGKSWLGKTIVTGLMGLGIADVAVLDRDDDYLYLSGELQGESQRYNLARGCPINFFDIPYGPQDVDPQDPQDLLSEFLDNALMTALALLVTEAGTELTRIEEAYLLHVARLAYAAQGITSEAIRNDPQTLLRPVPTLSDFIATMREAPASSEAMKQSLLERLERATYLFSGQTSISIEKPLTVFSIHDLAKKWYPLLTYTVQNFLTRHRALRRDDRYLAYVVEEASYMLEHPAGRRYLETGSRGFRKLGIAQITLSQHPREFLEEGQVILHNAGTVFYLGMPRNAAEKLHLSPELEHTITNAQPGQAVMRCRNEYASLAVASIPQYRALFETDPEERRKIRQRELLHRQQQRQSVQTRAS